MNQIPAKKTKKKRSSKTRSKKDNSLANAGHDKFFILSSGVPLKNLKELAFSLESMSDSTFYHHVSDSRNDFAQWISDVLDDKTLAARLGQVHRKDEFEIVLLRHLVDKYVR